MAALRGTLEGNRGTVSRLGSKNSGIQSTLNTWNGEISVYLDADGSFGITINPYEEVGKAYISGNVNTGEINPTA